MRRHLAPAFTVAMIAMLASCAGGGSSSSSSVITPSDGGGARVQMRPVIKVAPKGSATLVCATPTGCPTTTVPEGEPIVAGDENDSVVYYLGPSVVPGEDIVQARVRSDSISGWSVEYELSPSGTAAFSKATTHAVRQSTPKNEIAILVDGIVVAAPAVTAPITTGRSALFGLSQDEARRLAALLGSGGASANATS
jgi:preprotein translocase subunit SecD